MKKRTRNPKSGLAVVRQATGLTQQQFAQRLSTTKATIENIELNRAPLTQGLAEKIGVLTGAQVESLVSDSHQPCPLDFDNRPYSEESWQIWQNRRFDDNDIEMLQKMSVDYLQVLLKAALQTSGGQQTPHTFRSVLMNLNRFIFSEIQSHDLWDRTHALFATDMPQPPEFGETTVRWCRKEFGNLPEWKEHSQPQWKDSDKVRYRLQFVRECRPFMGRTELKGQPVFAYGVRVARCIFYLEVNGKEFRVEKKGKVKFAGLVNSDSPLGRDYLAFCKKQTRWSSKPVYHSF
jgi:transcriptional regulator with XRE-family HTH domain